MTRDDNRARYPDLAAIVDRFGARVRHLQDERGSFGDAQHADAISRALERPWVSLTIEKIRKIGADYSWKKKAPGRGSIRRGA